MQKSRMEVKSRKVAGERSVDSNVYLIVDPPVRPSGSYVTVAFVLVSPKTLGDIHSGRACTGRAEATRRSKVGESRIRGAQRFRRFLVGSLPGEQGT